MTQEEWEEDAEVTQMFATRPNSEEVIWNVAFTPKDQRPMSTEQVVASLQRREISAYTLVWREGMQNWVQIGNVPLLVQARRMNSLSLRPSRNVPTPSLPPTAPLRKHVDLEPREDASKQSRDNGLEGTEDDSRDALDRPPKPRSTSLSQAAPPKPTTIVVEDDAWSDEEEPTRQMAIHDSVPSPKKPPQKKERTLIGLGDSAPPPSSQAAPDSAPGDSIPPYSGKVIPAAPPRAARAPSSATARSAPARMPSVPPSGATPAPPRTVSRPPVSTGANVETVDPAASPDVLGVALERDLLMRSVRRWKLATWVLAAVSVALLATTVTLWSQSKSSNVPVNGNEASSTK